MKRIIFTILISLPLALAAQTTYYVSSSQGNDSNPGTSITNAWKSLNKVNGEIDGFKPNPGDKILFKRGDNWVGTIVPSVSGTNGNPITYGAYGSGEKPIIYGSEEISGWTNHSGNIFKANFHSDIEQLFMHGETMKLARHPNSGYALKQSDVKNGTNYANATYIERTSGYTVKSRVLTSNSIPVSGKGFIVTNKLDLLDSPGEWYYEKSTKTVYFWTPNNDSPSNYELRGSIHSHGVNISSKSYINIENINICQYKTTAIFINNGDYLNINFCSLQGEQYGLFNDGNGSTNINIANNEINGVNRTGIWTLAPNSIIKDNILSNIGLQKNWHKRAAGQQVGTAIYSRGDDCTISYNRISNSGYAGINFWGERNMIKYNFIDKAMTVLGDGGGIYTYNGANLSDPSSAGSEIMHNIILNCYGNRDGYTSDYDDGNAIYMDDGIHDVKIQYNTIYGASTGIVLHINKDIYVENNLITNCLVGFMTAGEHGDSFWFNNTVYAYDRVGDMVWWQDYHQRMTKIDGAISVYDSNTYIHHYANDDQFNNGYNFSEWKSKTGQDKNSTFDNSRLADGEDEKLFYNETKQKKTFDLGNKVYKDIYGKAITGSITLDPFTSIILIGTTFDNIERNNQAPNINKQTFEIQGEIQINNVIGQVSASDPDADQSLTYSIIGGNTDNLFSIDPSNGNLFANTTTTITTDQSVNLNVRVTDNGNNPLSATATVTINIIGVNQQTPDPIPTPDTSSPTITGFSMPATSSSLTVSIDNLTATDNTEVSGYMLSETSSTPLANDIAWSSSTPEYYTFSNEGNQNLYAWVKDAAGNISNSAHASVTITLPELKSTSSEYLFEESSGTTVFDTKGSVDGNIENGAQRISGINENAVELTGSEHISLGKSYGDNVKEAVTVSAWIKPSNPDKGYQGIVMHGGPNTDSFALYIHSANKSIGFKTTGTSNQWASVISEILFDGDWHQLSATYDGSKKIIYLDGQAILTKEATGSIESGEGYNCLIGKGRDEEAASLLYEGLIDEVRIANTAFQSSEISDLYNQVKNKITSINQYPVISSQSFEITQTKQINDFIGSVNASDPDQGQTLTYSITNGNESGNFAINSDNGDITASSIIETNTNKYFTLTVRVTDDDENPLSAEANIVIEVIPTEDNSSDNTTGDTGSETDTNTGTNDTSSGSNDTSSGTSEPDSGTTPPNQFPVIENQSFEINTSLNINDVIGQVIANDPDEGQNLVYTIESGNEKDYFSINSTTGIITANQAINPLEDDQIDLLVRIFDDGENRLSASATISILLKTVNQYPTIEDQSFTIKSNLTVWSQIGQIVASDLNPDQSLTYSILQGNSDNLFYLNQTTGELTLNNEITYTNDMSINLVIEVTDNGNTPLSSRANILININAIGKPVKAEVNDKNPKRVTVSFNKELSDDNLKSSTIADDFVLSDDKVVKKVTIKGNEIHLDLDSKYNRDEEIFVTYTKGATPIYDQTGNTIESFTNYEVENFITIEPEEILLDEIDSEFEVSVYPNPTNGIINVKANGLVSENCEIALYSMSGSLVSRKQLFGTFGTLEERLNMSHLDKGTYILHFINENENTQSRIIIM